MVNRINDLTQARNKFKLKINDGDEVFEIDNFYYAHFKKEVMMAYDEVFRVNFLSDHNLNHENFEINFNLLDDYYKHEVLLSFAHYDKRLERYNYESFIRHKYLEIEDKFSYIDKIEKLKDPSIALELYNRFMDKFDLYIKRDLKYYEDLIANLNQNESLYLVNDNAYMLVSEYDDHYLVSELIYFDKKAIENIIAFLADKKIIIRLSEHEALDRFFKAKTYYENSYMLKINDYQLLSRVYNKRINTINDFRKISNKTAWVNFR